MLLWLRGECLHDPGGIDAPAALAWISSFIQGRQQSVTFNGHQSTRSNWNTVCHRVRCWAHSFSSCTPQMSSPLQQSLGVGAHSYADDSQLYLHCLAADQSTAALRLAECIERVEGWMKSNRLKLNSDKTQFSWLGSSSWRRSTQRPWQSVDTVSNPRPPPRISAWHSTVNWEWTCT